MSRAARTTWFTALALPLTVAAAVAQQAIPGGPTFERPIEIRGPGPHKLPIDVPLLTAGQRFETVRRDGPSAQASGGLADLRLVDAASGKEISYLLIAPPPRRPIHVTGTVLPIASTKTSSGFEVDLGAARRVDGLDVGGIAAPFLKRFVLEGSGDRARWTVLIGQGTMFDLPEERVRQVAADFPSGEYRYLRLTWDDANSAVVPLPGRVSVREATRVAPPVPLRTRVEFERQASEPGRSRHRIKLPAPGLPAVAIAIEVSSGDVFRTASVIESRFSGTRADPVELGRARLVRTEGNPPATLRVPVDPPRGAELQLIVEDGSNAPLAIDNVFVEFAELPWIYFDAPSVSVVARYGGSGASAPQYDLEARRSTIRLDAVPEAGWGEPRPVGGTTPAAPPPSLPDRGARIDLSGFRYRRALPDAPQGLVSLQLDPAVLAHSRGHLGGFADVRVVDAEGYQVPYLLERRDEPLNVDLKFQPAPPGREILERGERGNRSAYVIALPYANLPSPRLVIETSDRVFRRPVQVAVERRPDRQHRDAWLDVLVSREWQHADQATPAEPIEMPVGAGDATELLLIVDEGDNRALTITAARLLLPSWRLRFFKGAAPVSVVYGHDTMAAPAYDLALLAPAVTGAAARDISAAPESPASATADRQLSPTIFWTGLGAAALILLVLLVRLISSGTAAPPAPPRP